jgi:hypothetical protein
MAPGYQVLSADGVVNTSGSAVRVYGLNIVSAGGGVGVVILRNGTTGSGTALITQGVAAGDSTYTDFGVGVLFPSGCYVDIDATITQATVVYDREG